MIDMTSWPELEVDVLDDVELDPNNIRLEMPVSAPQVDIMRDIFVNGDALSLVEAIVKVGYLTHETPIIVQRDGRNVVVEGNRRLAALKAIQNPYLVSEYQSRITALVKEFDGRDGLRKIQVKLAPDQEQANQVIAAIHTSNIRLRWPPARQAAFFQAQVDAGKTLPQLLVEYPLSSVRRFVRSSQLLNKFKSVPYSDPELRDFFNTKKFIPTTLSRIYESAEFTRVLGIEMRPNGSIKMNVSDTRFNRIATFIISGMNSGEFTSRTLPKTSAQAFQNLIAEIERIASAPSGRSPSSSSAATSAGGGTGNSRQPGTSQAGSGSNPSQTGGAAGGTAAGGANAPNAGGPAAQPPQGSAGQQQPASQPRRHTSIRLDSHSLVVPPTFPPAIEKIYTELITIHVQNYPNATMDLLRTFLEKVIKAYARGNQHTIIPQHGGYVQLGDCLTWLNNHVQSLPNHSGLSSLINRIQSRNVKQYPTSAAYLNDINHNPDIFATPQDAHELWEAMVSLMQLMLK
ncbi:ParB/Srx family N-terminal domain-containing protein [Pseudonocardia sp. DSM 110487]|uniref:ParB/Srx family N-terminal domain-containing protein n=1 Tax=Pseudonocardia sp. DSM 110487 TaxID=2865833 RepID=UPI001C6A6682|nr:ParB/Srx family N-terminal domain-containing protein [Pseudonocardia sp. DSM 110487]QYN35180.1 ParB/Srx family N-terminal domain-containing protein [Pseudonocardia sp. DSM 110487]